MHALERVDGVAGVGEEDVGAEDGADDWWGVLASPSYSHKHESRLTRPHSLHRLRQVDAQLSVSRRARHYTQSAHRPTNKAQQNALPLTRHIRIRRGLQAPEAAPDDERRAAEAAEALLERRGPHHEGADAVEDEAHDEGRAVAVVPEHPVAVAERGEGVGAEVG